MFGGTREWHDEEITLLRKVGETLSHTLRASARRRCSRVSEARLSALFENTSDAIGVLDDQGRVLSCEWARHRLLGYGSGTFVVGGSTISCTPTTWLAVWKASATPTSWVVSPPSSSVCAGVMASTSGSRSTPPPATISSGAWCAPRDITERKRAEAAVQARVELERSRLRLSQRALNDDAERFVASLDGLMAELGRLMDVDMVYVDEVTASMQMINIAGWSGKNVEAGFGKRPPTLKLTEYPAVYACHVPRAGLHRRRGESDGGIEWEHLDGVPDRGRAVVPMSVGGQLRGVLGLATTNDARQWTADERGVLPLLGATIASVLERRNLDRVLRASEAPLPAALGAGRRRRHARRFRVPSDLRLTLVGRSPRPRARSAARRLLARSRLPEDLAIMTGIRNEFLTGAPVRFGDPRTAQGRSLGLDLQQARGDSRCRRAVDYWGSLRDITDRKRLEAELEFQALHDPLTGLANRTLLQSRLEVALARRAEPNPVSLLLIDLDGFKEVNDAHGHLAGNFVLCELAARLKAVTRPSDTLARTGGDEFVLLCPETSTEGAVAIAERVVEELRRPVELPTGPMSVGGSVGVASVDGHLVDPDWLLLEADRAMYEAKRSGKGCVRVSEFRPDQLV